VFNTKGLLDVVDCINCIVQVNNKFLLKFSSKGSNLRQFHSPRDIALDSSGQVYVTEWTVNGGINMFSEYGQVIKKINCGKPYAICLTPDNYILY